MRVDEGISAIHISPLAPADIDRPGGIGDCYRRSVIQDLAVQALAEGTPASAEAYFGLAHLFDEPDLSRTDPTIIVPSVGEQMRLDVSGRGSPFHYRGKTFCQREAGRSECFATWWESAVADPVLRRHDRDGYVSAVKRPLTSLSWAEDADPELHLAQAADTVLFDTICGPEHAVRLIHAAAVEWNARRYSRVLAYYHSALHCVPREGPIRPEVGSRGGNARSGNFLRKLGFRDIGWRLGDTFAVRGRFLVLPTEAWMAAEVDQLVAATQRFARRV
jgi:hypothetical protein